MMGLVEDVTAKVNENCIVSKMKKNGCKVSLEDAPEPRLIVDFDKSGSPLEQSETRCDYLFVANGERCADWIALLELKKGSLDAGKVVSQLQAGAKKVAEELVSPNQKVEFCPTAAFCGTHTIQIKKLREEKNKVRFHSHVEAIRVIKCGASLKNALRS